MASSTPAAEFLWLGEQILKTNKETNKKPPILCWMLSQILRANMDIDKMDNHTAILML